jgi:N-acetylneuraminic acid mutarotase
MTVTPLFAALLAQHRGLHLTGDTAKIMFNGVADGNPEMEMTAHAGLLNVSGVMQASDVIGASGVSLEDIRRRLDAIDGGSGGASAAATGNGNSLAAISAKLDEQTAILNRLTTALVPHGIANSGLGGNPLPPGIHFTGGTIGGLKTGLVTTWDPDEDTYEEHLPPSPWFTHQHASAVCNGSIYLVGGNGGFHTWPTGDQNQGLRYVNKYPIAGGEWEAIANLPTVMQHFNAHCVNNHLWVFYMQGDVNTRILRYNPTQNSWEAKPIPRISNRKLYNQAIAVVDDKVYAIGGDRYELNNGGYPNSNRHGRKETYEFNTVTEQWTAKANMITGRTGLALCVHNGYIYAAGGNYHDNAHRFNYAHLMERYSPTANTWTAMANLPQGRTNVHWHTPFYTFLAYGNNLYLAGGNCDSRAVGCNPAHVHSTIVKYDVAANSWSTASQGNINWGIGDVSSSAQYQYAVVTE